MTNDLISREAAVKLLRDKASSYFVSMFATSGECHVARVVATEAASEIANMPAVDAVPVVHGHYGFTGPHIGETCSPYAEHGTCSNCKSRILIDPRHKRLCPECGAKMDNGSNEKKEN